MEVKNRHLVRNQLPEFISTDYPKFVEFLEAYYDFLDQYNLDILNLKNSDLVPENLLGFLRNEFAPKFPSAVIDDRQVIYIIKQVLKRKGSVSAIELLFRIFYGKAVRVTIPNEELLRASDGIWQQQTFLTVERTFGEVPLDIRGLQLKIDTDFGIYYIDLEESQEVGEDLTRFFYKSLRDIRLEEGQVVDIEGEAGLLYRGNLVLSPNRLTVSDPGEAWRIGQLVVVPADVLDTVAVVRSVGNNGELETLDIIQYGYPHTEDEIVTVYPYPNRPGNASFDITAIAIGFNPLTGIISYEYTLDLFEETGGVEESLTGFGSFSDAASYDTGTYDLEAYNGRLVSQVESITSASDSLTLASEVTLEEWLASKTTLTYTFDVLSRERGEWVDGKGQLSNPNIRLQDGYFYQLFSYVLVTEVSIDEFRPILNLIHPAGLKFFGELEKASVFEYPGYNGQGEIIED